MLKKDQLMPIEKTKERDVFIAGFPKSGNTWMQSLVSGIVYGIDPAFLPFTLASDLVVDVHARTFYKRYANTAYFKTNFLPKKRYRRVIYLVRDGRDAMVSYHKMQKVLGRKISMEDMIVKGKGVFPTKWYDHVRTWLDNPYKADMLIVRYEDLLEEPLLQLQRICEFLELERRDELLEKVIEGNSFAKMKAKAERLKDLGHPTWKGDHFKKFFREGKAKGYGEQMPEELLQYFNREASVELKAMGYF